MNTRLSGGRRPLIRRGTWAGAAFVVLVGAATMAAQGALDVGQLAFGPLRVIAVLETGRHWQPSRLAWSPDGSQLYVQTIEGAFPEPAAVRHHLIELASGAMMESDAEPDWLAPYWTSKSHQTSPDARGQKIELQTTQERKKTVSIPRGGDLARGGTTTSRGTTPGDASMAAYTSQVVTVHTMSLHGKTIGRFENSVIVPGLTFGWGPAGSGVIAYATPEGGKLMIMNAAGVTQEVAAVKDALLPAWSPDAARLAWLQKDGRRKYLVKLTTVQ